MKEADQKDYENSGHVISLIKKDDKPESKKSPASFAVL